ncbi:hypothetical protein M728_002592 [Ensifer sp. WSM1721]
MHRRSRFTFSCACSATFTSAWTGNASLADVAGQILDAICMVPESAIEDFEASYAARNASGTHLLANAIEGRLK